MMGRVGTAAFPTVIMVGLLLGERNGAGASGLLAVGRMRGPGARVGLAGCGGFGSRIGRLSGFGRISGPLTAFCRNTVLLAAAFGRMTGLWTSRT
jgi:hypothetical protein